MNSFRGLSKVEVRFGWNDYPRQQSMGLISGLLNSNVAIDCDARAVFCKNEGSPIQGNINHCCLYYGNMSMFDGAAKHLGDNKIGGNGDDEIIVLDLGKLPSEVGQIILTLDRFKDKKAARFGRIHEAFVRIVDQESGQEIVRNDISNFHSGAKMVVVGKLQRMPDGWQFIKGYASIQATDIDEFISNISKYSIFKNDHGDQMVFVD